MNVDFGLLDEIFRKPKKFIIGVVVFLNCKSTTSNDHNWLNNARFCRQPIFHEFDTHTHIEPAYHIVQNMEIMVCSESHYAPNNNLS